MPGLEIDFDARPSVAAYMLSALRPGFLRGPLPFPPLRARWRTIRPDRRRLDRFVAAAGRETVRHLPITFPHLLTYPLQMVILTHRASSLPVFKALQVRNRLLQHRCISPGAVLDAEAMVAGQRVLEKGLELDLHVAVSVSGELAWEALTTYFYRGRFGRPELAAPLARPPAGVETPVAGWRTDPGGGLRFGGVSGDTNGIHWWDAYARRFGFRAAFHHPHALVAQCLTHLAGPPEPAQRLELWFKGPVYYGVEVDLTARNGGDQVEFALTTRGEARPALLGRWSRADRTGARVECH